MYKKLIPFVCLVCAACLVGNPLTMAATRTWDNEGGDNRWDNAVNWSANKIPTSADDVRIVLAGAGECLIDSAVIAEPKNVFVGYEGAAGDLRMTGGLFTPNNTHVGRASVGRFFLSDGTVNTTNLMHVGDDAGGVGTLTVSGGTMNLGNTEVDWQTLHIGRDGATGTVTISGGVLSIGTLQVGNAVDSLGNLVVSGGTINVGMVGNTNAMNIANSGAKGTATISDGIINVSGYLNVGNDAGSDGLVPSDGLLEMLGGTVNIGAIDTELDWRDLRIGHNEGVGVMNMSGGTVNVSGDLVVGSTLIEVILDPFQEIPHPGTGRVTMTGGLISIPDANSVKIGTDGSTGLLELFGGTIRAGALEIGEPGSGGIMDIRAGTLILDGDRREKVLAYIQAGLMTAYGGASGGEVRYDYDIANAGKTTVTAIPEPATVLLIGLGGFALIRRKRSSLHRFR